MIYMENKPIINVKIFLRAKTKINSEENSLKENKLEEKRKFHL